MSTKGLRFFQIDAFASGPFTGNPAAVVLLEQDASAPTEGEEAGWPDDGWLQSVAAANNLSETVFFHPARERPRLRWFTPAVEVDLCGHATLASGFVVLNLLRPRANAVTFESVSGPLEVRRSQDDAGALTVRLPSRPVDEGAVPSGAERALGCRIKSWQRAKKAMAVLEDEAAVRSCRPDLDWVRELDTDGLIITAAGQRDDIDFVSRYFAPHAGIDEDPVTGSAHCSLAPFWAQQLGRGEESMPALQVSERLGTLWCRSLSDHVEIAGRCSLFLEGRLLA